MEANNNIDDYKSVALRYPNKATVKKLVTGVYIVFAAAGSFVLMACQFKSMYGGPWLLPLVIASLITAAGLGLLLFTKERQLKE